MSYTLCREQGIQSRAGESGGFFWLGTVKFDSG